MTLFLITSVLTAVRHRFILIILTWSYIFALLLSNPVFSFRCHSFVFCNIFIDCYTHKIKIHHNYIPFFTPSSHSSLLMTTGPALLTRSTPAWQGIFTWSSISIHAIFPIISETISLIMRLMVIRWHNHQLLYWDAISRQDWGRHL